MRKTAVKSAPSLKDGAPLALVGEEVISAFQLLLQSNDHLLVSTPTTHPYMISTMLINSRGDTEHFWNAATKLQVVQRAKSDNLFTRKR